MEIPDDWGDESFADDLNMWPGIVSGRVALLLRSTEIQPAAAPICPLLLADVGFSMALQLAAKKVQVSSCSLPGEERVVSCLGALPHDVRRNEREEGLPLLFGVSLTAVSGSLVGS